MKKNLLIVMLICFVCLFSLVAVSKSVDYRNLATDSGFDSSYDGGSSSSSSSSSWSSDSSSGGGGGGSSLTLEDLKNIGLATAYFSLLTFVGLFIHKIIKREKTTVVDYCFAAIPFAILSFIIIYILFLLLNVPFIYSLIFPLLLIILVELIKKGGIVSLNNILWKIVLIFFGAFFVVGFLFIFYLLTGVLGFVVLALIGLFVYLQFYSLKKSYNEGLKRKKILRENNKEIMRRNKLVEDKIINEAFEVYKEVQIAWMNDDIDSVSDILSDEMLNMYKSQLATMRIKNEQNIMSNINFIRGQIEEIIEEKDGLKLEVNLCVICHDYIINKETKEVLRGNKQKTNYYSYRLTFLINKELPKKCPNCGKPLKKGGGVTCSSCGSKLILNNGKMMMIDKKMINQG